MSVSNISRYNHTVLIRSVNGVGEPAELDHMDIVPPLVKIKAQDNHEYIPAVNDNWSRIAWRTLGDGRHWWIIAEHSDVVDPWTDLLSKQRIQYVAQLTADVSVGVINQITVDRPKRITRGTVYRVENLDPDSLVHYDVSVLSVNNDTGVIEVTPFTVATAIPAELSRVSLLKRDGVSLTVPNIQRVLFEALDFSSSLVTLVE